MSNGLAKRLSRLELPAARACNSSKDSHVLRSLKEIRARLAKLETQKPRSVLSGSSDHQEPRLGPAEVIIKMLQKQSVQEFLTTQNGFRLATSVGGVLTGRGADFIISEVTLHGISVLNFDGSASAARWEELSIFAGIDHRGSGVSS